MSVLISFLAALAAAIIVITIAQTAAAYPNLPAQVPVGFEWNGNLRNRGPRPMIWLVPAVQILVACVSAFAGYGIATQQPGTHGSLLGLSIAGVAIFSMMWRVQSLLLSAAQTAECRLPASRFLPFFVVCFVVLLIDAFAIR